MISKHTTQAMFIGRLLFCLLLAIALLAPLATLRAQATLTTGTPFNIVNENSGLCIGAAGQGTANGTALQMNTCANGTYSTQLSQEWIFTAASSGYYEVSDANATSEAWNVVNVGTTSGSLMQIWSYGGASNEEFSAVSLGSGYYKFVGQGSGLCLDVPGNSTATGVQLEIYTCNGTTAQAFKLVTPSASGGGGGTGEGPYPGPSAAAIPGTVMNENYDTGGQGVAYNVTSTNGTDNGYRSQGVDLETASSPATGNDLGWSAAGQWFKYTVNVSTAGSYTVSFLVAAESAIGDAFHLSNSSGTNLTGSVAVPDTGGWQTWTTVTATATLPAGTQTLTLNEDAAGWNIDHMVFASGSGGGGGLGSAPITAGTYTLTPQCCTALRLDDESASTATGNPIDVYTANGTGAQNWALSSNGVTPSGYYNLATEGAYCLTASGTTSGSTAVLDPCTGASSQAWAAVASGSNYIFHPASNTALCLDVEGASSTSGTLVDVYTCNSTNAQSWALGAAGSGGGGGTGTGGCSGVSDITIGGTTYTPTWCQSFGGAAGPAPTSAFNYDLGNNGGWGNGELEVYCGPPGYSGNPSQCPSSFSTSTAPVYIDGAGHLVIQPRDVGGTWISARLNTSGRQTFQYGILEATIQLPNMANPGLWPAFWALGNNINSGVSWPTCGESDILEDWSPSVDGGGGNTAENSTIHTQDTGGDGVGARYNFPGGEAVDTAFHTYGMIWSPNELQYFVDNPSSPFATFTPNSLPSGDVWPFNQPIFMILNEAIGGTLGGSAPSSTPGPMYIQSINYYQP